MAHAEHFGTVYPHENAQGYRNEPVELERTGPVERQWFARDRVRWGPIWAGLMTTLSMFLVLTMLMYGLGAQQLTVVNGTSLNNSNSWVTAIVALISFFLGGWVTTMTASVRGASGGILNGFMVWALGIVLILALSSLGVGMAFGAAGNIFDQLITVQRGQINMPNLNLPEVSGAIRNGALWGFFSLVISACSAMLGGWVGSHGRPIGRVTADTPAQVRT